MKTIIKKFLVFIIFFININFSFSQDETKDVKLNDADLTLKKNSTQEFRVTGFNTNFIIPTIRVNFFEEENRKSLAKVSAFNSIGAGISFGGGRLKTTTDENFKLSSVKYKNTLAIQFGVLYSIINTDQTSENVFALTTGFNFLNFSLSAGKEFGNLKNNQKKHFITLSYNVPLSELISNSFYIFKAADSNGGIELP